MREIVDLNCDMGEGFGQWALGEAPDEEIMSLISSANIAAGFHAGDPNSMDRVVKLAQIHGVGLGAHPGYNDLQGFGRRYIKASSEELVNDIVYQVGALREFGRICYPSAHRAVRALDALVRWSEIRERR